VEIEPRYPEEGISPYCRKAYLWGEFLRPAKIDPELAERIVAVIPAVRPRTFMWKLLVKNSNRPTWINHALSTVINRALERCDFDGRHFRLGRDRVMARVWEVSVFAEASVSGIDPQAGRPSMWYLPEVTQLMGLSR
jgi:hypothetical protein